MGLPLAKVQNLSLPTVVKILRCQDATDNTKHRIQTAFNYCRQNLHLDLRTCYQKGGVHQLSKNLGTMEDKSSQLCRNDPRLFFQVLTMQKQDFQKDFLIITFVLKSIKPNPLPILVFGSLGTLMASTPSSGLSFANTV